MSKLDERLDGYGWEEMKKPTPEEIIAASYPAIQERATEMDKADDMSGVCLRGEHQRCETAMAQAHGFSACRCVCHTAPKPDAPSDIYAEFNALSAENQKLREALERIATIGEDRAGFAVAGVYHFLPIARIAREAINAK